MQAPLRCGNCGQIVRKKPKAKTPKYCPPCRQSQQDKFREIRLKGKGGGKRSLHVKLEPNKEKGDW
jgi:hypothetical protein